MVELREIMTHRIRSVSGDVPVAEAAGAMIGGRVGSVLVMAGSTLMGILTERDVLRAAAGARDLTTAPVRNWMTPDPIVAGPDTGTEDAERTMLSQGFRHLPVVDGGSVVGIVSLRDLLSARIHRRT